jgi:DNA mismatch repair protein MutS
VKPSVRFHGILFDRPGQGADPEPEEPPFFADLNLDQVLESIVKGREEYDLAPLFYTPLADVAAVRYRHEVLRDLQKTAVREAAGSFAQKMRRMREALAQAAKLHHTHQKQRWLLDAVAIYCGAVTALTQELGRLDVESRGLRAFRDSLAGYAASDRFTSLAAETHRLVDALATVRYSVHIKASRVTVSRSDGDADYSAEVEKTFERFKRGSVKDYRVAFPDWPDIDHVEARVLELVAGLHPEVFLPLEDYCGRHRDYLDPMIGAFDREVQFYLAYLEYAERFASAGLSFCYPEVSAGSKEISAHDAFDLALADKLVPERLPLVCNDLCLRDPERVLVVTGPNQGGKTTFARMFGQLHYLASLGCPVPGTAARLFLPDRLFTHFEREEDLATLRGKLEDDLVRMRAILEQATPASIVIVNESLTSTTLNDALVLSRAVMEQIVESDLLCVWVTFLDELASLGDSTVSMVSTIVPENPAVRTYRIVRRPADGLAYAAAIADKYGLTYERLAERVAS